MQVVKRNGEEVIKPRDGLEFIEMVSGENMNLVHFRINPGVSANAHKHPNEQIEYVYRGTLTMEVEGEEVNIEPGDSILIPGNVKHYAENRGDKPVKGVAIFSPPRADSSNYGGENG